MAESAPEATTPRTLEEIREAWEALDVLYRHDPMDSVIAGARAAAEWTEGMSSVSPVTNRRQAPLLGAVRWESHAAAMRQLDIGVTPAGGPQRRERRAYAYGASCWMFWWTGLEPLPVWLLRRAPIDPAAS